MGDLLHISFSVNLIRINLKLVGCPSQAVQSTMNLKLPFETSLEGEGHSSRDAGRSGGTQTRNIKWNSFT